MIRWEVDGKRHVLRPDPNVCCITIEECE